jgi:DNA-binding HxlR family transcriptional regulator
VRPYGQYCPVAKGAELLGDRWTLLIVRELLYGPLRFTEIERGLPRISRSVLSQRLKALRQQGIIELCGDADTAGYQFTQAGEELRPVLSAIGDWAGRWIMIDPEPSELDLELLTLWLSRHVDRDALPTRRVVVEFRFVDGETNRTWLLLERHEVSMCLNYPGFPLDLIVSCSTVNLYRVYIGRATLAEEVRAGRIIIEGTPRLRRAFTRWMTWAECAPVVRESPLTKTAMLEATGST